MADALAGAPGSAKPLQECMQKFLAGRGYGKNQMAVLPEYTEEDMPRPFVNLGECVNDRGKLVVIQGYVPSKEAILKWLANEVAQMLDKNSKQFAGN